jgi:uncharacterized DUF497 family protein
MDVFYELDGITFVWDKAKARRNLVKHGIAFEEAAEAFFDPFFRVVEAGPEEEARGAIIGIDERWNPLFVVHIVIEEDGIRIISARKTTCTERQYYYED